MTVITPTSLVRTVAVTAGASELVWTQLTELAGIDIQPDTYSLALVPNGEAPDAGDFGPVDQQVAGDTPNVVRLALLVSSATVTTRGGHTMWARVVDTAETLIFPCSGTVELE